jgi:hypothetical protein
VILKWKLVTQGFGAIVPLTVYNESESFGNKPNILDDRPSSIEYTRAILNSDLISKPDLVLDSILVEYQMNQLDLVSNFRD